MIDTAYTLTSYPSASPSLSAPIAFKKRSEVRPVASLPAASVRTLPRHAAAASPTRQGPGRWLYFGIGMALLFLIVQASVWTPFEGVDLLFIRLLLFVGASVCFLASSDGQEGAEGYA